MTRVSVANVGRLLRTARYLEPSQGFHRARLRVKKRVYASWPHLAERRYSTAPPVRYGWPTSWQPTDAAVEAVGHPSVEDNARGIFCLLNERRDLGTPIDWDAPGATQLWRYHLHYFDWAWDLLQCQDRTRAVEIFGDLYASWRASTRVGVWDAWSPYVVALRSWTLCSLFEPLVRGADYEDQFVSDLGLHASYLAANTEFDVGGNHLIKDLKALIGLGAFLGRDDLWQAAWKHLDRQIAKQVLPDGGHFELSPSYHAQVLLDFIDLARLTDVLGRDAAPLVALGETIEVMRQWLCVMLLPHGDVPLLNDCVPLGVRRVEALGLVPGAPAGATLLPHTGYAVLRDPGGGWHGVVDVGPPCPPELPAHAQADPLHLVLSLGGEPILVDTGTSTYAAGQRRQYERSTRAHNTLELDATDATEVWGSFRAGRRHRVSVEEVGPGARVVASHDGFRRLGGRPVHRRDVRVSVDGVRITDRVDARSGAHTARVMFHLAPGLKVRQEGSVVVAGPARLKFSSPLNATIRVVRAGDEPLGRVAAGHGQLQAAHCVVVELRAAPGCELTTTISEIR